MDQYRQWLPPNPSPSYPSLQNLEDQLSHMSLSGLGLDSQFPNNNYNNQLLSSLSANWESDQVQSLRAARSHGVNNNMIPGSSSYSPYPNLVDTNNVVVPGLGLGLGLSSGSGFISPSDYSPVHHLHNGVREVDKNDIEFLRWYYNIMNNKYSYRYLKALYDKCCTPSIPRHHHHRQINNNNNTYNRNSNSRRRTTTWSTRNREHNNYSCSGNSSNCGSITPVNMDFFPCTWEEIRGKVVDYANDKGLSESMINKFQLGQIEGIKMIVSELKASITEVLFNPSGSSFFQKLLEILDYQDIFELFKAVIANQQDLIDMCFDSNGTRAVQKLVKHLNPNGREEQTMILNSIRGYVLCLTKNMNSSHCVQEVLRVFKDVHQVCGPILDEIADHFMEIALDKSGCCILQACVDLKGRERDRIVHEIITHAVELADNNYGNFVVQYLGTQKDEPHIIAQVVRALQGIFTYLSKNNFGSYVVQKFLIKADDEHAHLIIKEIFDENDDPNSFLEILQHPFGNFVAKSALIRSKEMYLCGTKMSTYLRLVDRIEANYPFLHSHMYGKNVLNAVKGTKYNKYHHHV